MSRSRKPEQDYYNIASKRGFEWLGYHPGKTRAKTKWRCPEGHEWSASYDSISRGRGCPLCANYRPKTKQDYHDLAVQKNFNWIDKVLPRNIETKTLWQCSKGHEWNASYISVRLNGCPHCAGNAPKIEQDYHNLAAEKGFKWIGKMPSRVLDKTLWQCSLGHKWKARYSAIYIGRGCPKCRKFKGPERIVQTLRAMGIDSETEKKFSTCRHKQPLPFDFFIPVAKLLIEYQGEHHFKSVWGPLSNVKRNDAIKANWVQQNGYELLCINYWDYDRITEILADRLKDYTPFEYYKQGAFI